MDDLPSLPIVTPKSAAFQGSRSLTNGETHTLDNGSSVKAQVSGETLLGIIQFLASVLQEGRKSTNIHAGLGVIRGIPAKEMVDTTAESPTRAIRCDPDWEVDQ